MGILKRKAGPRRWPAAKPGVCSFKCSNTRQKSCSAILAGRSRLAWERPLRLGAVAPRKVDSGPECNCSESHRSLSPMQWVSWASSKLTACLHGLNVRDLSVTPVSRAILETSCSGMRLQIWRKTLNRDRVGLIFLFFMPAVWQVQIVKPTLFSIFYGMAVKSSEVCMTGQNDYLAYPNSAYGTYKLDTNGNVLWGANYPPEPPYAT